MKINSIGHLVKVGKTKPNKPKVKIGKMNVTSLRTMNYEQKTMNDANKNKPKQTQFQTQPCKNGASRAGVIRLLQCGKDSGIFICSARLDCVAKCLIWEISGKNIVQAVKSEVSNEFGNPL